MNPLLINTILHDNIKVARMNVLSSFMEYVKRKNEEKFRDLYKMTSKESYDNLRNYDDIRDRRMVHMI